MIDLTRNYGYRAPSSQSSNQFYLFTSYVSFFYWFILITKIEFHRGGKFRVFAIDIRIFER